MEFQMNGFFDEFMLKLHKQKCDAKFTFDTYDTATKCSLHLKAFKGILDF